MEGADIGGLSLKELKVLISSAGLSFADCIDKGDLRARAREAQAALQQARAAAPPAAARSQRQIGGYQCIVSGANACSEATPADLAIIVLHGLGATNEDFADLPQLLVGSDPELRGKRVLYVMPQAPQTPIGAAWWLFDVMRFQRIAANMNDAEVAKYIREEHPGLAECRVQMLKLVGEVRALAGGVEARRVVLAGFSLGAITAMDATLHRPAGEAAGVAMLSGVPIDVETWAARLKLHPKMRALVTHGAADPLLPVVASTWTKGLLEAHGIETTYVTGNHGHDLGGPEVVGALVTWVKAMVAAGAAPGPSAG